MATLGVLLQFPNSRTKGCIYLSIARSVLVDIRDETGKRKGNGEKLEKDYFEQ